MLGSRAVAGGLDPSVLKTKDAKGISIEQALRDSACSRANRRRAAQAK